MSQQHCFQQTLPYGYYAQGHYHHSHGRPTVRTIPSCFHPTAHSSQIPSVPTRPTRSPTFLVLDPIPGFQIDETVFGSDLILALLQISPSEQIVTVTLSGFPFGAVVAYVDQFGNNIEVVGDNGGPRLTLSAPNTGALFSLIESLTVTNSVGDDGYNLQVQFISGTSGAVQIIELPVIAPARISGVPQLDLPGPLHVMRPEPLFISVLGTAVDDSEVLTVSFIIATDGNGTPIGSLEVAPGVDVPSISFTPLDSLSYIVSSSESSASAREVALNIFLQGGIVFRRDSRAGNGEFPSGISVTATLAEIGKLPHHFTALG